MATQGNTGGVKPFASLHSVSQGLAALAPKVGFPEAAPVLSVAAGAVTMAGLIAGEQTVEQETLDAVRSLTRSVERLGAHLHTDLESVTNRILDALAGHDSAIHREALERAEARFVRAVRIAAGIANGSTADVARDRSDFEVLRYADTATGLALERDRLEQAIPALCTFAAGYLEDMYARHGGDAVELALEGARLTDLATSAVGFYTLLFTPSSLIGAAPKDLVEASPVLRTNLALFEGPFTTLTATIDRLMTRAVLETDTNIRVALTARLRGRTASSVSEAEAAGLLSAGPGAANGFAGLTHVWPWLDFVVMVYPPERASAYRAPVGSAGAADPAPGCGSQWQHVVIRDGRGHDWFISWSPKPPTGAGDRSAILGDYRWRWSPGGTQPAADRPALTAREHAWRVLTGVDGWRPAAGHWSPTPRVGFAAEAAPGAEAAETPSSEDAGAESAGTPMATCLSRTQLDGALLDFARALNPYEIARRFPAAMARTNVPLAFLAYWDAQHPQGRGWGYRLTKDEKGRISMLNEQESWRGNPPQDYGFLITASNVGMATTDPGRVHLWGPRALRRARPEPQVGWTQIGLAVVLA